MVLAHPLAQRLIRGETVGPAAGLLQAGEHSRCEGDRFASRDVCGQQDAHAPGGIERQLTADGVAVDAQQARHVLAALGLPSRQEVEHWSPQRLMGVMFMVQALLERGRIFTNRRYRIAHG
jgi:hypothetical protein